MPGAISVFATACGVLSLYLGWKRLAPSIAATITGWGLILAGGWSSILNWGFEFGPIYTCLTFACIAWFFVCLESDASKTSPQPNRAQWPAASIGSWGQQALTFLFTILVSGLATMLILVLATRWLPWQMIDRTALVILLTPILWGVFMFWTLLDPIRSRLSLAGACIIASITLVTL